MDRATLRSLEKSCRILLPPEQEERILLQLQEIEEQLYQLPEEAELESSSQMKFRELREDVPHPFDTRLIVGGRRNEAGYYVIKGQMP